MNIVSAEFKADPFPVLVRLRSEEPIHRTTLPDKIRTPVWLITRYEDVNAPGENYGQAIFERHQAR